MAEEQDTNRETLTFARYPGWCSFCRKHFKDLGPLAEGPDQVFICHSCCLRCAKLIHAECQRIGIPLPEEKKDFEET